MNEATKDFSTDLVMSVDARLNGSACRCTVCRLVFANERGFDAHRVGEYERPGKPSTRRCRTIAELIALGCVINKHRRVALLKDLQGGLLVRRLGAKAFEA